MANKSRLQERELNKRRDATKIEIGADLSPEGNKTTDEGAYLPPEKNFGKGQHGKR